MLAAHESARAFATNKTRVKNTMDSQDNIEVGLNRNSLVEFITKQYPDHPIVFDVQPGMLEGLLSEL